MILQPLEMIMPSKRCIETPSRFEPDIEITQAEFNENYADSAKAGLVSFHPDGISSYQKVTKYTCKNKSTLGRFIIK